MSRMGWIQMLTPTSTIGYAYILCFFYYLYTVHINKNTHVHMHTAENCVQIYILCELISKKRTGISKTGNVDHLLKITVENAGPLWA